MSIIRIGQSTDLSSEGVQSKRKCEYPAQK